MARTTSTRMPFNALLLILATALIAVIAHIVTAAPDSDGRINVAPHLGGDVMYCVDGSKNATSEPNGAGLRLLNLHGQELFYVSPAQIDAVPEFPAQNTLIAQGSGSNGPISLYRLSNGEFQLNGMDEHGKPFFFSWSDCTPVNPIPDPHDPVVKQNDLIMSNDNDWYVD